MRGGCCEFGIHSTDSCSATAETEKDKEKTDQRAVGGGGSAGGGEWGQWGSGAVGRVGGARGGEKASAGINYIWDKEMGAR